MNIAIVITAYNRPEALKNLLSKLLGVRFGGDNVPLIISIDNKGTEEVNEIANSFVWPFGEKKVFIHQQKKGLVKHFIWTGDQTEEYENVIFLEDDLLPSPEMYNYAKQMIEYYKDDDRIAAGSLYNPVVVEATGTKFYQLEDGYDTFFLQQPYWGHVWMKEKWRKFKKYLETYEVKEDIIPPHVAIWTQSFKKIYIQYLLETNRTVVSPRLSVVTNNGVGGLHSGDLYYCQSTLLLEPKEYKFAQLDETLVSYNAYFEILPSTLKHYNSELESFDFEVDLNGTKQKYEKPYVLTTRSSRKPILEYSSLMKPTELGVVMKATGKGVVLCKAEDVIFEKDFIKKRRYKDVLKNYYLGIYASQYISIDFIKLVLNKIFVKNTKAK